MSESMPDFREQLAALAHEQWAGWMRYLFSKSIEVGDGNEEIPSHLVQRWMRQMDTSYTDLPENEKDSDRAEADKMLALFRQIDDVVVDTRDTLDRLIERLGG